MKRNSFTPAAAGRLCVWANLVSLKFIGSLIIAVVMLLIGTQSFAQQVNRGREVKKGEMNFTETAKYFKAHPQPLKRMELENEEDEMPRPEHPAITDPSQVHRRKADGSVNSDALPSSTPPTGSMPVSFAPVDTFESTLDNGMSIPPDTHGAVDSNYCVTTINTAVKIQTRAGALVSSVTLNQFWLPVLPGGGAFDPRVHYDPYTKRWIIVAVSGANSTSSSILIAVSKTSNPTGAWWMYSILASPGVPYWLDYPNVGYNNKWITITGNLFGSSYGGAKVFVFNKANLLSGASATYTAFTQTSSFTICPAITYDPTTPNMFAVETWNGGAGYMHVWKITGAVGAEVMTNVGYPVSSQPWQGTAFPLTGSGADFAPQSGIINKIQTNDDRVSQVIFMNNKLWFAHTIFLPYSTTVNPTHASVQWWQTDTLANPIQIGRIDDNTAANFYAFPTIAVNTSDDALIGFSALSATTHPSAAYSLRMHTDPIDSMRPLVIYKHGLNTYYKTYGGSRDRWGDYSAAALDPVNMTDFWTLQETVSATANMWDTWWAHVTVSGCSTPVISGTTTVCTGAATTLSNTLAGGVWSSSNPAVATISATGVVTGITAGTATISYTPSGGCAATTVVTVNALPTAGSITGSSLVGTGLTTTLANTVAGGVWSSSNAIIATITAGGIVTGVALGSATITYSVSNSCGTAYTTMPITVSLTNHAPYFTGGSSQAMALCQNTTISINGMMAIADVDAAQTETWTVNTAPLHGTLSGLSTVMLSTGGTIIPSGLSYAPTAGYSGSDAFTIKISDGITTATTTINVTVNPLPSAGSITGATSVTAGSAISLADAVTGGVWSSSNASIASVSTAGVVTGVTAGTATITYAVSNSCGSAYTTRAVTVTAVTHAPYFTGGSTQTMTVCQNTTTSINGMMPIADADAGQTEIWTVSAAPAHGTLSGFSATMISTGGTVTPSGLTYTPATGYSGADAFTVQISDGTTTATTTVNVTVNPLPSAGTITGASSVATGSTTALANSATGGVWSSSNASIATISTGGMVTGVVAGSATITYSVSNSCGSASSNRGITVSSTNYAPYFSGGSSQAMAVCQNSAATSINSIMAASDADAGQTETWTVSAAPLHGTLSGFSTAMLSTGGTITPSGLTYTPATGYSGADAFTIVISDGITTAATTINVTVNALPSAGSITGPTAVSTGSSITLVDAVTGGVWSSSSIGIATVSSYGVVTGISTGFVNINYTVTNACGSASATVKIKVSGTTHGGGHGSLSPVVPEVTIYPNPTKGAFTVQAPSQGKFYLISMSGTPVMEISVAEGATSLTMPSGSLPGLYIGRFQGDDGSSSSVRISYQP